MESKEAKKFDGGVGKKGNFRLFRKLCCFDLMAFLHFQLVLLTIVLLAAFGNDGIRLTFGKADFLGVGVSFGLAITVPLILIAYLCGGNLFVLVSRRSHYS